MADRVSIAIRQQQAVARMITVMGTFSERFGVIPADIPVRGRDAELLRAEQFEALAGWLERLADAVAESEVPADPEAALRALTNAQLVELAAERGVDVPARANKDALVALLVAAEKGG